MARPRTIDALLASLHLRARWTTAADLGATINVSPSKSAMLLRTLKAQGKVEYQEPDTRGDNGVRIGGTWRATPIED